MPVKSPKAALARAIAAALDRFIIVDQNAIETSLFLNANVRLVGGVLRQRHVSLSRSELVIHGTIELIELSWTWGYDKGGWVRDAKLTLRGLHITVALVPRQEGPTESITTIKEEQEQKEQDDTERKAQSGTQHEPGAFYRFLRKQVDMILDSLDIDIRDLQIKILLPNKHGRSIQVGCDRMQLFSLGRQDVDQSGGILNQTFGLEGFFANIIWLEHDSEYPQLRLVDPFYFVGQAEYRGKRFVDFPKNVQMRGQAESDLNVFAGDEQLSVVSKLGVLILPLPANATTTEPIDAPVSGNKFDSLKHENHLSLAFNVDCFRLDVGTATIRGSACEYVMNKDRMDLSLDSFQVGGRAKISGKKVKADLMGSATVQFGSIDELFMDHVVELERPLYDATVSWVNGCAHVDIDAIDATLLTKKEGPVSSKAVGDDGATRKKSRFPLALILKVDHARLQDEEKGNEMVLESFDFSWNRTWDKTDIAFSLQFYQNRLVLVRNAYFFGSLPISAHYEMHDVQVAVDFIKVTAGRNTQDWLDAFTPRHKKNRVSVFKIPHVKVDPVQLEVTWKGPATSLESTKIAVNAYTGKEKTTTTDLIMYYARACVSRVPEFLTNAEILGLNVFDTGFSVLGSAIPFSDIALIGARDTVRKVIENGKKSRQVDSSASTHPFDIFRGLIYSVEATSKEGASTTGLDDESVPNPVNLTVGTAVSTGRYVYDNKTKLAAAVLGGSAAVVGGMFGGPGTVVHFLTFLLSIFTTNTAFCYFQWWLFLQGWLRKLSQRKPLTLRNRC